MESLKRYAGLNLPTSKESLTVYLQPEVKEALKQMADEQKRSMAFVAEQAIVAAVDLWQAQNSKKQTPEADSEP